MTYAQQLLWLAQRFKLSEDEISLLDLRLHLTALQTYQFVFEVASNLISGITYQDERALMEAEKDKDNSEKNTKYLEQASTLLAAITATEGGDLHIAERVVAEWLYDFALLVESRLKQSTS